MKSFSAVAPFFAAASLATGSSVPSHSLTAAFRVASAAAAPSLTWTSAAVRLPSADRAETVFSTMDTDRASFCSALKAAMVSASLALASGVGGCAARSSMMSASWAFSGTPSLRPLSSKYAGKLPRSTNSFTVSTCLSIGHLSLLVVSTPMSRDPSWASSSAWVRTVWSAMLWVPKVCTACIPALRIACSSSGVLALAASASTASALSAILPKDAKAPLPPPFLDKDRI
mmetsp:Transcript_5190/g.12282  ORF Transcript_5190/g.12282 Transcript_5190/m.12282 type:complete len:229 (-) Transcript_5190:309-995(-)